MPSLDRLEDIAAEWRGQVAPLVAEAVEQIAEELSKELPGRPTAHDPALAGRLTVAAQRQVKPWTEQKLLPACLGWLKQYGRWDNAEVSSQRVEAELGSALDSLPRFEAELPAPTAELSYWIWALLAGAGAILGGLLLTPLTLLLFDSRESGLFLGGPIGAVLLVGAVAFLASRPTIRAYCETALAMAGAGSLLGALWRAIRGRRATDLLRSSFYFMAGWVLLYAARMRPVPPSRSQCLDRLKEQLRDHLSHLADLVLALCWAHPDRLPRPSAAAATPPVLPDSVLDALTVVQKMQAKLEVVPEDLRDAVHVLLQRIEEEGYAWKAVDRGTPYAEEMRSEFENFGVLSIGQPVETLQPAILRGPTVVKKGKLRKI